jgi:hypothetical protein
MNAGKLKTALQDIPDEMEVYIAEIDSEFKYAPVEQVRKQMLDFRESPAGSILASEIVVVIDSNYL